MSSMFHIDSLGAYSLQVRILIIATFNDITTYVKKACYFNRTIKRNTYIIFCSEPMFFEHWFVDQWKTSKVSYPKWYTFCHYVPPFLSIQGYQR